MAHMSVTGGERIFDPAHRAVATGLLLSVTMIAFEALGTTTAMNAVARDLDGFALYGWTFSAGMLASLVGIAVAGPAADRLGPGRPFAVGLVLFAAGLLITGLAPEMWVVVAGRVVQGFGFGVIPPVVYTSIGRTFGEGARARMFALLSTAWVVPGLVGPAIAGFLAENVGWRWVFLGVIPLVPLNALLALPALERIGPPPASAVSEASHRRTWPAIRLASATGLFIAGLGVRSPVGFVMALGGAGFAVAPLRRLLPAGTFMAAPGIPAAVATRGLQTLALFTADFFVPVALTEVRGFSVTAAGLAVTLGTLSWTAGSWVQERRWRRWGRRRLVSIGLFLLGCGIAGVSSLLVRDLPAAIGYASWMLAGLGMGLSYGGVSLAVLSEAPAGQEGAASSAVQLSDVLGVAVGSGVAGAVVAAVEAAGRRPQLGLAVIFAMTFVAAVVGSLVARRLPADPTT